MKTLKEYITEASILDIEGTMQEGNKFEKAIEDFENILNATTLKDFNNFVEKFASVLDVKKSPKSGDMVARMDKVLITVEGKKEYLYWFSIGYRGKRKRYNINYSPWVNKTFIEIKHQQITAPFSGDGSYYGIVPDAVASYIIKSIDKN